MFISAPAVTIDTRKKYDKRKNITEPTADDNESQFHWNQSHVLGEMLVRFPSLPRPIAIKMDQHWTASKCTNAHAVLLQTKLCYWNKQKRKVTIYWSIPMAPWGHVDGPNTTDSFRGKWKGAKCHLCSRMLLIMTTLRRSLPTLSEVFIGVS